jgi:hypothetical protein
VYEWVVHERSGTNSHSQRRARPELERTAGHDTCQMPYRKNFEDTTRDRPSTGVCMRAARVRRVLCTTNENARHATTRETRGSVKREHSRCAPLQWSAGNPTPQLTPSTNATPRTGTCRHLQASVHLHDSGLCTPWRCHHRSDDPPRALSGARRTRVDAGRASAAGGRRPALTT